MILILLLIKIFDFQQNFVQISFFLEVYRDCKNFVLGTTDDLVLLAEYKIWAEEQLNSSQLEELKKNFIQNKLAPKHQKRIEIHDFHQKFAPKSIFLLPKS